jgi:hypothetical protein
MKVKSKIPQQFKAASDIPLAVILGQDELAAGKVRVKQLGLPHDHPERMAFDLVPGIRNTCHPGSILWPMYYNKSHVKYLNVTCRQPWMT